MRAAVLETPGDVPVYREHPDPVAAPGHTAVRVTAVPLVPLDLLCASGTSYFGRPATPYVPGVQGVGIVESSAALPTGTRVFFSTTAGMAAGDGGMAQRCVVRDVDVVPVRADLSDPALAALGLSGVAAWMALTWRGRLSPGEHVLVLGAGGAVGQAAVGAARVLGAGRVVAVCRTPEAQDRARRLGAAAVVALRGGVDDLAARIQEATGPVDVVVDPVFGIAATAASRVLAPGGRLVNLGGASGDVAEFSSAVLRGRPAEILGYTNNALSPEQRREALTALAEHAARGRISVAHEPLPLSEVADAWRRQATGSPGVRLVLTP
ncbi:MAG: zinc-binding dehydrogenase [Actinomycetota bacterium]|nr:zinc-binding dehydrogenase [Actinomycetota bacterium]